MTKLSDLVPRIPGQLHGGVLIREEGHFYNCPNCGQKVDQRDLRQVFWHEEPGHEPLEPETIDDSQIFSKEVAVPLRATTGKKTPARNGNRGRAKRWLGINPATCQRAVKGLIAER